MGRKCQDEEIRLADYTVKSQELLREEGVEESLLSIITNVNRAVPEEYAELDRMCSDLFAAYVALRRGG